MGRDLSPGRTWTREIRGEQERQTGHGWASIRPACDCQLGVKGWKGSEGRQWAKSQPKGNGGQGRAGQGFMRRNIMDSIALKSQCELGVGSTHL